MNTSQILAFTGIAMLLTLTPGADTMLVVRNVLTRGPRSGLLTTLGICCGLFFHATLSALGLSMILVRSANLYNLVKWAGAGYLLYLGIQSLWHAARRPDGALTNDAASLQTEQPGRGWRSIREGLFNNILNPKVAIFYLAFLPQFISPGDPVLAKSILLAGIHFLEGILWLSLVSLFLGKLRVYLSRPTVQRGIEACSGTVLIAFGARLALEQR